MRSTVGSRFAHQAGFSLMKTPSHRQQVMRRRLMIVCTVLGLALASGLIGSLSGPRSDLGDEVVAKITTGPFSYFPHQ